MTGRASREQDSALAFLPHQRVMGPNGRLSYGRTFASSDRIAFPSAMVSSSKARYSAFKLSNSLFALMQKGHRDQLKTTTWGKQRLTVD